MKIIYKYPLQITDEQTIEISRYAKPLCVQVQNGIPCLWAEVDTRFAKEIKTVYSYGTGHTIDRLGIQYLGTYQIENNLVFHVYL